MAPDRPMALASAARMFLSFGFSSAFNACDTGRRKINNMKVSNNPDFESDFFISI
jgi:hypothetical protein